MWVTAVFRTPPSAFSCSQQRPQGQWEFCSPSLSASSGLPRLALGWHAAGTDLASGYRCEEGRGLGRSR